MSTIFLQRTAEKYFYRELFVVKKGKLVYKGIKMPKADIYNAITVERIHGELLRCIEFLTDIVGVTIIIARRGKIIEIFSEFLTDSIKALNCRKMKTNNLSLDSKRQNNFFHREFRPF